MNIRDLDGALCVTHPTIFDGTTINHIQQAVATCAQCPALHPCRTWAKTQSHTGGAHTRTGINGGVVALHGVIGGRVYGDAHKTLTAWRQRHKNKGTAA